MRVYGHLRDQHSTAMAAKVTFGPAENIVPMPKEEAV
jgi:acyl CoA:acetate/3-ketoacid CoA transferase alpha subunit